MLEASNNNELPAIPGKRYFTIGEVSELCAVKPHVLRYWEDEFEALQPNKNRSGQRLYEKKDVELILKITHTIMLEQYKDLFAKCGFKLVDQKNGRVIKEGLVTDFSMISIRSGTGLWLCGRGSDLFGTLSIL